MSAILSLSLNDLRNILREQILRVIFIFLPIICLSFATWAVPPISEAYPEIIPYYPVILMLLCMQITAGVGFVSAAMFLEEKDQHLLPVIQVLPMSSTFFLGYRLLFTFVYTLIFALILILGTGLLSISVGYGLLLAFLFAFPAPVIMLIMSVFAGNKVEGLAIFKGVNFIYLLPLAAFFMDSSWKNLFAVLPVHGNYQFLWSVAAGSPAWEWFGLGLGYHGALLVGLIWVFRKRVL